MVRRKIIIILIIAFQAFVVVAQNKIITTQVLVVGGGTGGIAAALQSASSGASTVLVEQTNMLGGMLTAAGVSCTDGNDKLYSGIWQRFRNALYEHYHTNNLAAGWVSNTCFEPHAGDSIFKSWATKEKNLSVHYNWHFDKTLKAGNKVTGAGFINKNGQKLLVYAAITIDATDLGDVFADAEAKYDVGMEDPNDSKEKEAIEKNNIIQDITWAAILKDYGAGADKTIMMPDNYNASKYDCSTADAPCNDKPYTLHTQKVLDYGKLTTVDTVVKKYMLNWPPHGNDTYLDVIEIKPIQREPLYKIAKDNTLGFIYFLQTKLGFKHIGLADDELNKGMAVIPYHREGRRVRGVVRLNIEHIKNPYGFNLHKTGIAVGDYPVDHHHGQYPGKVPPINFPQVPAFNIPIGALIPAKTDGLIVCDKGISVSNIANGSTRLQPVVLLTGQAAGIMAAKCVKEEIQPRLLRIRGVQDSLLKLKCYIMPFADVMPGDASWEAVQRTGSMGILQGEGKSIDWENKMFFHPDTTVGCKELAMGLQKAFNAKPVNELMTDSLLTIEKTAACILAYKPYLLSDKMLFIYGTRQPGHFFDGHTWREQLKLENFNLQRAITRKELAVVLNYYSGNFTNNDIDFEGRIKNK